MGTIDKIHITLTCENCHIIETNSASDKGNPFSGSFWRTLPPYKKFDAEITGGEKEEPDVHNATCKSCGKSAKISYRHSL